MKVLFVYPNTPLSTPPPVSIGILNSLLKIRQVETRVFDTTFYINSEVSDKAKEKNLQVRPFSFNEEELPIGKNTKEYDLVNTIKEFQPNLIAFSCLESTWFDTVDLLNAIQNYTEDIPIIVGGIFPTFSPEVVLKHPTVDMICIGEGEWPLYELVKCLQENKDYSEIKNLWIKTRQGIIKNGIRKVLDINLLPVPDYSVFHPARFLRPMAGKIYRAIPIETNRGCPFTCSFCNSPSMSSMYRANGAGKFFRKKNLRKIYEELKTLVAKHEANYVYFLSDTFLVMSPKEFDEFVEMYSEFKLPFWIQTRAETIDLYRAKKLKEIGCHRISIGLEQGNEKFRREVLKKRYTNQKMIAAANALTSADIPFSVNNIIGFPQETRELIFDTIELNRQIKSDTLNAYAFAPFRGTELHDYCVENNLISEDRISGSFTIDLPLNMPQLSREEIDGLRKTFVLYSKMDKEYWPMIEQAEKDDEILERLKQTYKERYF